MPPIQRVASTGTCADPFVWWSGISNNYHIQCTGGALKLGTSPDLSTSSMFSYDGDCLGGTPASWASEASFDSRWAPENVEVTTDGVTQNYMFFADTQSDGIHRIGWVATNRGTPIGPNAWTVYSNGVMNLGNAPVSFAW